MGLFDRLFNKNKADSTENGFDVWLDNILKNELPDDIEAICFNLYEDSENQWSAELVGTDSFDEEDSDWACDEVYSTREFPYVIKIKSDWKAIEKLFTDYISDYLDHGKYSAKLKQYNAVAVGFVDGDLNIIYKK